MNKVFGRFILLFTVVMWTWLHVFCINKIYKNPEDLKEVSGTVSNQHIFKKSGRSKYEAVILGLRFQKLQFAIHEKHERAFDFLKNNYVVDHRVAVLYDPDGYNGGEDLTYHIFGLKVDDQWLLKVEEAANQERLFIKTILIIDAIVILIFLWVRRQHNARIRKLKSPVH